jgi:hypothetical protein
MGDRFGDTGLVLDAPGTDAFAITPHDSTNFNENCRAIYIGGAGNIVVVTKAGNAVTFTGVLAGTILPVRAMRVNSTNTTATNLVGII